MKRLGMLFILLLLFSTLSLAVELPPQETFRFSVSGSSSGWDSTNRQLRPTEVVQFNVFGSIKSSRRSELIGPEGQGEAGSGFPCPEAKAFTVVGKLGENGKCFEIGQTRTFLPDLPDFLYLTINDDSPKDNAGKFVVEAIVTRPVCGDNVCDVSEEGFCSLDCQWCGDNVCSADETCSSCAQDCGICQGTVDDLKQIAVSYYGAQDSGDYKTLTSMTIGDLNDYYQSFERFQKEVDLITEGYEDELPRYELPFPSSHTNADAYIDLLEDDTASLLTVYDEGEDKIILKKGLEEWKIEDVLLNNEASFVESINFEELRESHNNYLDEISSLTESSGGFVPSGIMVNIVIVIISLLVLFGLAYGGYYLVKKEKIHLKKFFNKTHSSSAKPPKHKVKKEDKKASAPKPVATKACSKCSTKLFEHEKFCVKCGKRV